MATKRRGKARKSPKTEAGYCPRCGSKDVSRNYSKPGGVGGAGRNQDFVGLCNKCQHRWPV